MCTNAVNFYAVTIIVHALHWVFFSRSRPANSSSVAVRCSAAHLRPGIASASEIVY